MNPVILPDTFNFLKRLSRNNNRDWFNAHKDEYLAAQKNVELFIDALIHKMNGHDRLDTPSGKKSLYRIYNDVRFSSDKTPYNPRFSGYLRRLKPSLRGGYYYWIKPGESRIGCGFAHPNAEDLQRLRIDIRDNFDHWNHILKSKGIRSAFGALEGDLVKTAPRGFEKDDPAISLLRYKNYWFEHSFTDKEVLSKDFLLRMDKSYQAIRPFFDYATEVLTTNSNGESIL